VRGEKCRSVCGVWLWSRLRGGGEARTIIVASILGNTAHSYRHDDATKAAIRPLLLMLVFIGRHIRCVRYITQVQFYYMSSSWTPPPPPPVTLSMIRSIQSHMDSMYICRAFRMGIHFRRKDIKYRHIYFLVGVRLWEILQNWWCTKLGYAAPFIAPYKVTSCGMTHARYRTGKCPRW